VELHSALDAVIDGGYFVGGAPVVDFERSFADYLGVRECVGVGNGLDGIRLALEALGIGPGDEVIVPGFTFYATWLAVTQVGAVPIPVDVELETAGMDVSLVEEAITPRTRAVLVVHLYGIPAPLRALRRLADDAQIALIEDAAQSHGAVSDAGVTGTVGDMASFSFYPTKNLGAFGDGGAVTTGSAELAAIVRRRRSYGQGSSKYEHVDTGWNSRLDTLQAAFLSGGLQRLDSENVRRREIASVYLAALGTFSHRVVGHARAKESVWHHFVLRAADRDSVRAYFSSLGIATDVHYPYAFADLRPMSRYSHGSLAFSERLAREVTSFPISPWLDDAAVARVADAFASIPERIVSGD
jgi:dTDP-4-amino-4,6-dideoxygalactose transaminase